MNGWSPETNESLEGGERMKAIVDADLCTACGLCEDACPEVFELGDEVAEVKVDEIPEDAVEAAKEAADDCPSEAITIEE